MDVSGNCRRFSESNNGVSGGFREVSERVFRSGKVHRIVQEKSIGV